MDDPWLTDRLRADLELVKAQQRIEEAVTAAIAEWLAAARALLLGENMPENIPAAVTAAGDPGTYDLEVVRASFDVWQQALQQHIEPAISEAFGTGFGGALRSATISVLPYQERHIATVHDRLRMWPAEAWEDMRPEIQQVISRSETIEQASDQIAGILDINAPTRELRQKITEVEDKLEGAESPGEIRELRALRRQLWNSHDQSLGQWQHLSRRIARTEVQGAIEGGQMAGALATQQATGQRMYKRWLATKDNRSRRSHRLADGQIVPIDARYRVGRADLMYPAEPGGPAHEVIHCRCTQLILSEPEVNDLLSGGRAQGVRPGSLRYGPDTDNDIALAQELMRRSDAGEDVQWPEPPPPPQLSPQAPSLSTPTTAPAAPARRTRPGDEFRGQSFDDLNQQVADAVEAEDFELMERVLAELDRRAARNAAAQERRTAQREAREAQQMADYDRMLAEGVDDEEAVLAAFGISIERQRRINAISYLRGLGYQGDGLDQLIRAWHQDEALQAWRRAEDDLRGQLLNPEARAAGRIDPRDLWTMNESHALTHASEDLQGWWDEHGRVTAAELKAQLLDPTELARIMSGRRDYLQ